MGTRFRKYRPDQQFLIPPDPRKWIPKGHLAHHVSDLVDSSDLSAFYERYQGDGRRNSPYAPRMMVKVWVYGYATGVRSSRKLARKLVEDVPLRVLAAGNFPKHRTLCDFRKKNLEAFKTLLVEIVRLAREMGFAGLGQVAVDGTKVRANASKRKAMSYGRMGPEEERLKEEIAELLAKSDAVDAEEDARDGKGAEGDERLLEELERREDRLAAIQAAKERLEAEARAFDDARGREPGQERNPKGGRAYKRAYGEPEERAQSNFTDPESRIMKTSTEGFQQCYNAQVAVDGESQLVVGTAVTDNASDQGRLIEMVDEVEDVAGEKPREVLADAGYGNEGDLAALEDREIDGYVALGREGKEIEKADPERYPARARMVEKLATPEGRAVYAKRKWMAEAPIRVDQGGDGVQEVQSAWLGERARGVGSGVSGAEHAAIACPVGSVRGQAFASGSLRGPLGPGIGRFPRLTTGPRRHPRGLVAGNPGWRPDCRDFTLTRRSFCRASS